jgi:catechol 2,3-dioxygenase-like lactoylglutathione lyase family enzyme
MIRIKLTSVMVDDQAKALDFYTNVLGFAVKRDISMGEARWLTVVTGGPNCFLSLRPAWLKPPGCSESTVQYGHQLSC